MTLSVIFFTRSPSTETATVPAMESPVMRYSLSMSLRNTIPLTTMHMVMMSTESSTTKTIIFRPRDIFIGFTPFLLQVQIQSV